jgi:putative ABC transport system substrate-binding protein
VIGFLGLSPENTPALNNIRDGLAEVGYVEGRDFVSEYRALEYQPDRIAAQAADLVQHQVALIVAVNLSQSLAAKTATKSTPIVFWTGADPVATGLVESLSHPGGNLTGASVLNFAVIAKRLEVLHELIPGVRLIGHLTNPNNRAFADAETRELQVAARALGVRLLVENATEQSEIEGAFASLVQKGATALVVGGDSLFFRNRFQLAELAARSALPATYASREYADAGGLASLGTRYSDGWRLAGNYAGRILKGEKPSDLPVQQVSKTELVINLRTAKALGITMPPPLLARADEVIE